MTTPNESTPRPYQIPDFEKDAQSLAAYDEARVRFERREAGESENKIRASFAKKREAIRAEIAVAASLLEERRIKARDALQRYASRYPHRIEGKKPVKPSFWENLFALGAAGRLFKRAVQTAADAAAAQTLRSRKEHDEEDLEKQLKRTLHLQEEAIKKRMESQEGAAAFHARPGIAVLHQRVEEIRNERAAYKARLERGLVTPDEQRDREFAERKIARLEAPFAGLTIVRVVRYGDLAYFLFRDLERKLSYFPYDPRLEPLIEHVIDVYRLADSFEVKLTNGKDNRPMPILQHYTTTYKDDEVARTELRKARTAFRTPRADLPPMVMDPVEEQLADLLAGFAKTLPAPGSLAATAAADGIIPGPAAMTSDVVGGANP